MTIDKWVLEEIQKCVPNMLGFTKHISIENISFTLSVKRRKCQNILVVANMNNSLIPQAIDKHKYVMLNIFDVETIIMQKGSYQVLKLWLATQEYFLFGKKVITCRIKEEYLETILDWGYRTICLNIYTFNNPTFEDIKQMLLHDERFQALVRNLNGDYVIGEFKTVKGEEEEYFSIEDKYVLDYPDILFRVIYVYLYSQQDLDSAQPFLM
jgi:hypothetical protein